MTASSIDWSGAAWPAASLPHPGQSPSAGQPDLAWGVDVTPAGPRPGAEVVYLVEEASTSNSICTPGNDGVFFSSSDDGGAHWDTSLPVSSGAAMTETIEPAIAADRNTPAACTSRIRGSPLADGLHAAARRLRDLPDLLHNGGVSVVPGARRVSPIAASGTGHYRDPSLAVLPDGRVIVAFRDELERAGRDRDLHARPHRRRQLLRFQRRLRRSPLVGARRTGVVSNVGGAVCRRRASWPPEAA